MAWLPFEAADELVAKMRATMSPKLNYLPPCAFCGAKRKSWAETKCAECDWLLQSRIEWCGADEESSDVDVYEEIAKNIWQPKFIALLGVVPDVEVVRQQRDEGLTTSPYIVSMKRRSLGIPSPRDVSRLKQKLPPATRAGLKVCPDCFAECPTGCRKCKFCGTAFYKKVRAGSENNNAA